MRPDEEPAERPTYTLTIQNGLRDMAEMSHIFLQPREQPHHAPPRHNKRRAWKRARRKSR